MKGGRDVKAGAPAFRGCRASLGSLAPRKLGSLRFGGTDNVSARPWCRWAVALRSGRPNVRTTDAKESGAFRERGLASGDNRGKSIGMGRYFRYFGTYEIDEAAGVVAHLIEGSWFPNLVGKQELRHYRFE